MGRVGSIYQMVLAACGLIEREQRLLGPISLEKHFAASVGFRSERLRFLVAFLHLLG